MGSHARRGVRPGDCLAAALMLMACIACSGPRPEDTADRAIPAAVRLPQVDETQDRGADQGSVTVFYTDVGFTPRRLEIDLDQQVTFVNRSGKRFWPASNIHPTHKVYPEFDAGAPIPAGESWSFTFDKAGFWRYHNHAASAKGGLVVVTGGAAAPTPVPLVIDVGDLVFEDPPTVWLAEYGNLFQDDALLTSFTKRYGPADTVRLLKEAEEHIAIDCHQRAHDMGRIAYELFGALAFSLASHECYAGAYHGATEALFRERGTANLESDVAAICDGTPNRFFRHQCVHGVGHGLLAWATYEMPDALPLCDNLEEQVDRLSCYSGIFMENVVGGLSGAMGHYTEYLSDDPHFPCNILDDKYVAPCYYYQSSRMLVLSNYDYAKVAQECANAPPTAQRECFLSFGRDVGNITRGQPATAIELCSHSSRSDHRVSCLEGTAQDRFWDIASADDALDLCYLLQEDYEKGACYWTIINRAKNLFATAPGLDGFCLKVEEPYRAWCP